MDNSMDKYLGTYLDERYEILETIGTGGMAVVYKAMCHRLNRYVAVKILRDDLSADKEFRDRFQKESQAVAMLSHPNIVSVYDVSHSDNVEYIVMELIEGITLKQYMKKKGAFGWKEAMHFSVQIAKAMEHAHAKGIIHRDIKPQNIMILKDGTIKVADFGIAALESAHEKRSGQALGSVNYIAPEQAKGDVPDARSDIYSLGVVMYEMLTGELPYSGETENEIAMQHITGTPVPPSQKNREIPAELERITMRAMAQDIDERYQSATELLDDLEGFRKLQAAALAKSMQPEDVPIYESSIIPDVMPISRDGEIPRDKYLQRRHRSRKVSILTGAFGVLLFMVAAFVFLWNFWLEDIFRVAERVDVPDFIGSNYNSIINNKEFSIFNFKVVYAIDPEVAEGIIISQDPEGGRSLMVVSEGIDVELTVSTGVMMTEIPDVINWQYQEATLALQRAGFVVESAITASDTVTEDYVIGTNPAAGEELPAGSTVYITVSGGPSIKSVTMPNLVGLDEQTAVTRINSSNLSYGSTNYVHSDHEAGVVFKQSTPAYTEVDEHTKIYIWVSLGPEETPSPSPTATQPPESPDITPPNAITEVG
ncbi:MAG TPA: Stk1 family PASTA domain-containing Ser/Thr kinase [Clostridiales bacterium]|nr:Stk1 family PASTA domain-containing Ser/Thr kinase [Clostridiales bacterium]